MRGIKTYANAGSASILSRKPVFLNGAFDIGTVGSLSLWASANPREIRRRAGVAGGWGDSSALLSLVISKRLDSSRERRRFDAPRSAEHQGVN